MKFATIDPRSCIAVIGDFASLEAAELSIGLEPMKTDHGLICRAANGVQGLGVVVHEFGLYQPAGQQRYFAIEMRLYAGPAILFAFDLGGVTVDVERLPDIRWFDDAWAVERAIIAGEIMRPHVAVNNEIIWRWPEAAPPDVMET